MADGLSGTSKSLAGKTPEPKDAQAFEVICSCGKRIQGIRTGSGQRVRCESCHHHAFVLPRDVYPPPRRKKSGRGSKKKSAKPGVADNDGLRIGEQFAELGHHLRTLIALIAGRLTGRFTSAGRTVLEWLKSLYSPFRLLVLVMLTVVVGTAWWGVHRSRLESAERTLREATERGDQALAEEDFPTASREFAAAVGALDQLQRNDAAALAVRQKARESRAASQLLKVSLFELAGELSAAFDGGDPGWATDFRSLYEDEWLVLETELQSPVSTEPGVPYELDLPLLAGDQPVVVQLPGDLFARFASDSFPRRVVFAARIESFSHQTDGLRRFVIGLHGESAFLWSSPGVLTAIGFATEEEDPAGGLSEVLAEQAELQGVTP